MIIEADEFITPFIKESGNRVILRAIENPSVKATLEILEEK